MCGEWLRGRSGCSVNESIGLVQGFSGGVPRNPSGSARSRDWKNKHRFLNLLAKINRSREKYHSLLKRALTIIIGLLYLKVTDHANVPWAVDIIIFMQGFPETWKLFQGFLQGKNIENGWVAQEACRREWRSGRVMEWPGGRVGWVIMRERWGLVDG
jgi:hypothetical protein